jgi:hypothetical protein
MRGLRLVAATVTILSVLLARSVHAQEPTPGSEPAATPSAPAPGPEPEPVTIEVAPAPPAPSVLVHIQSHAVLRLEALSERGAWASVCTSPCDARVELAPLYRIVGEGVVPSRGFHLVGVGDGERLVIGVSPGSKSTRTASIALLVTSGVSLVTGVVMLGTDALASAICSPGFAGIYAPTGGCSSQGLLWGGLGALALGVTTLVAGLASMPSTDVEVPGKDAPPSRRADTRDDRWVRLPTWRQPPAEMPPVPTTTSVPLFTGTF